MTVKIHVTRHDRKSLLLLLLLGTLICCFMGKFCMVVLNCPAISLGNLWGLPIHDRKPHNKTHLWKNPAATKPYITVWHNMHLWQNAIMNTRYKIAKLHCVWKKVDPQVDCYNSTKTCQTCPKFYTCKLWIIWTKIYALFYKNTGQL